MCSRREVDFRQGSSEVSVFEATPETATRPPSGRKLDPTRAVKKYRRSAAGTSKHHKYPPRSIPNLYLTVDYLANLLVNWQRALHMTSTSSFMDLINFLEDRIRAVQVDLVVSGHASKEIQYKIVKIHVLTIYLLGEHPKYERRHGIQALQTALTSYWNEPIQAETDDELLGLAVMVQLNEDLAHLDDHPDDDTHTFGSAIMSAYRKQREATADDIDRLPRFEWSLRLVTCCNGGEWSTALRWLLDGRQGNFGALVACVMAPSLARIRAKALQAYNVSFMKNERLEDAEVARLLSMNNPADAREFCSLLQLPVQDSAVSFKSAPIHMEWTTKNRDDAFVFRGNVELSSDRQGILLPDDAFLATLLE